MVADDVGEALGAFGYSLFEVPVLPMYMRRRQRHPAVGWYPAVHVSVFSSGVTFPGVPVPMLMRPKHRDAVDVWYPAVHVFLFPGRVLPILELLPLSLRSLAPVLTAQRFNDSGPTD